MTTALVVDSTALLTPELVEATGAIVVPITISLDGVDHLDGVDLSPDDFYARLAEPEPPTVSTAQPSPGRFLEAYTEAADAGADSVLAVLVGSAFSATFDAARWGAGQSPIPVTCVDSGQASFGVALCALAGREALDAGASPVEAAAVAEARSAEIESVFIVQALELAHRSGRFIGMPLPDADTDAIPVLRFAGGDLSVVGEVNDVDEAVEAMATAIVADGRPVRVASGLADLATKPVTDALEERLAAEPNVVELIRYRVGAGVAANVGPGTAGVFLHPVA